MQVTGVAWVSRGGRLLALLLLLILLFLLLLLIIRVHGPAPQEQNNLQILKIILTFSKYGLVLVYTDEEQ